MRKVIKGCNVISKVLMIICVIALLLLFFFRAGSVAMMQRFAAGADEGTWLAMVTTLSIAAVMFAACGLAWRSMEEREFMTRLSSAILEPAYAQHDLSDKRLKPESNELDFNASLRDVTDEKERVLRELAWEKQHNKKLQKKMTGSKLVSLFFFLAGLAFLIYPVVMYYLSGTLMSMAQGTPMDYFSLVALILTLFIASDNGSGQGLMRRLNTILSIRSRNDTIMEEEKAKAAVPVQMAAVSPVYPVPVTNPAPVYTAPAVQPEPAVPAPPPETEPTDMPPAESVFENLTPEEPAESAVVTDDATIAEDVAEE